MSILREEAQDEFVNQRRLAGAAGASNSDDLRCSMFDARCLMFRARRTLSGGVLKLCQLAREQEIGFQFRAAFAAFTVMLLHIIDHVGRVRPAKKILLTPFP